MKELSIPPAAVEDEKSVEILRAWIAGGAEWLSLNPHIYRNRDFDEEWAWGLFLADTIRHISNAISELSGEDPNSIAEKIRDSFLTEFGKPTTEARGGFLCKDDA